LNNVKGVFIPFITTPVQERALHPNKLSKEDSTAVYLEIISFLKEGVIAKAVPVLSQFIYNIFVRPKLDGKVRIILDLTSLNKFVEYKHFKMFSLSMAIDLVTPGSWMGSVDLKQAYYYVPIAVPNRRFLLFRLMLLCLLRALLHLDLW
jgi:hypothetical protein